jgi:hypothetical protein
LALATSLRLVDVGLLRLQLRFVVARIQSRQEFPLHDLVAFEDEEFDDLAGHLESDLGVLEGADRTRIVAHRGLIERSDRLSFNRPYDLPNLRRRFFAGNQEEREKG